MAQEKKGYYAKVNQRLHEEFLPFQQGKVFSVDDICIAFQLSKYPVMQAQKIRHAINEVIWNISQKNKEHELEQIGNKYRLIDKTVDEVKWWEENTEQGECPLRLPLGLNDYCVLDTPCLIVIASPTNQGKTALMLNILNQNLDTYKDNIFLFESDPVEQLKRRFKHFEFPIPIPPPFKVYRRLTNFEDVIVPNGLNLIDYVRVDVEKIWAVQNTMLKLLTKLGSKGIAVVALQKPPGRDLAYGKDFSAFDSTLYLSIDKNKIKFIKIKTPKQQEDVDPYKIAIEFKIRYGVQLYDIHTVSIDREE